MKQIVRHIIAIACAVYFLLAGSGYNIVRYCCESCAHAGIEAVAHRSCGMAHKADKLSDKPCCGHEVPEQEAEACADNCCRSTGCSLIRLHTDTPTVAVPAVSFEDDVLVAVELFCTVFNLYGNDAVSVATAWLPPDDLPALCGRDILTHHAVLRI